MKETNFLSAVGPQETGGIGNPGTGINLNVPSNTSPDFLSMILGNLPNIFSMFGPQQPLQPVRQDYTPYYILGGAAIVFLLTSKK
jgi:hypothetical protein